MADEVTAMVGRRMKIDTGRGFSLDVTIKRMDGLAIKEAIVHEVIPDKFVRIQGEMTLPPGWKYEE
jgi:hypothetical protein